MRILIAEDETIIRLDLRGALEAAGYEVREAQRRRRGRRPRPRVGARPRDARREDADPRRHRGGAADHRRAAPPGRPRDRVLGRALVERAVGAGVFGYLLKPFRESEIVPALETAWARHSDWLETRRELGRRIVPEPRRRSRSSLEGNAPLPGAHRAARRRQHRRDRSPTSLERPLHLALRLALDDVAALVPLLLAARDRQLDLHPAVLEVEPGRHDASGPSRAPARRASRSAAGAAAACAAASARGSPGCPGRRSRSRRRAARPRRRGCRRMPAQASPCPSRSDFTSVPVSTMPASNRSISW